MPPFSEQSPANCCRCRQNHLNLSVGSIVVIIRGSLSNFHLFARTSICCTHKNFLKIKNFDGSFAIIVMILCPSLLPSLSHFCRWSCCSQCADLCAMMMVPFGSFAHTSSSSEVPQQVMSPMLGVISVVIPTECRTEPHLIMSPFTFLQFVCSQSSLLFMIQMSVQALLTSGSCLLAVTAAHLCWFQTSSVPDVF